MTLTYAVTGASRGLGLGFVRQISSQGHTVFTLARNPEDSELLQSLVDNKKVFAVKLDATSEQSIKDAEEVGKKAPEGIDVFINNTGINGDKQKGFIISNTHHAIIIYTALTKIFITERIALNKNKTKKILNISSFLGSIADLGISNPTGRVSAYAVSKAALKMLTKLAANHLAGENFIVYSTHPGWLKTDMGGDNAPVE